MIPRKNFVRIMNKKAAPLVQSCIATPSSNPESCMLCPYLTPGISEVVGVAPNYKYDRDAATRQHSAFIDIIAELEDEFKVVERNNDFYKSHLLSSIQLCPDDLIKRLKDPVLMPKAIDDWKLADEFLLTFALSSPVCLPDRLSAHHHPNSGVVLFQNEILTEIDRAVNRIQSR